MHTACDHCGAKFEREGGFFLGSIYLNYGLTALVTAVFYPLCLFNRILDKTTLMVVCVLFAVLFPLWFFRYARSLWLGFDHFADPPSTASEPTSNHPPSRKHLDPEFPAGDSESE